MCANSENAYDQGVDAYNEERFEDAVACYLQYLTAYSEDEDTLFNLACAYVKTGELHHARNIVKSLIVSNPALYQEILNENDLQPLHDFADDVVEYSGIGGWLLFFILSALYIQPTYFVITTFFELVFLFKIIVNPYAYAVFFLVNGVGTLLIVKWILIGGRLKNLKPEAVQETKLWLGITLSINIAVVVLLLVVGRVTSVNFMALVLQIIILFAWIQYFKTSIRVQIMYSDWWISRIPAKAVEWRIFDPVEVPLTQPSQT